MVPTASSIRAERLLDEKRLKALSSKNVFSLRAPYARQNENFKRLALLCGTSNESDIITDRTGNRRILMIYVNSINHAAYNEIDKDELFMEIYRLNESGEKWEMDDTEGAILTETSQDFEAINPEAEILNDLFWSESDPEAAGQITMEWSAMMIKNYIETHSSHRINSLKFFGLELKRFFGKGRRTKHCQCYSIKKKPV